MTTGLPSVASANYWPLGFRPEAREMHPPFAAVTEPWLTYAALPSKVTPNAAVNPVGLKATHSLTKLQQYDSIESLNIIDFPSLGITYNGGWCSATKTR